MPSGDVLTPEKVQELAAIIAPVFHLSAKRLAESHETLRASLIAELTREAATRRDLDAFRDRLEEAEKERDRLREDLALVRLALDEAGHENQVAHIGDVVRDLGAERDRLRREFVAVSVAFNNHRCPAGEGPGQ